MTLEDNVLLAQKDDNIRNDIIKDYKKYISSCASKTVGKYITDQDDEMSIAMIAFNEAITKYDSKKGPFLSFANISMKNRLIDFMRKEYKSARDIPFSALSQTDQNGDEIAFDVEDTKPGHNDERLELEALTIELNQYKISFFDLPKATPKSKKTKNACFSVIRHIMQSPILVNEIKLKGLLPIKTILEVVKMNRKVIERHRLYIITAIIILTGDYDVIGEYFKDIKEV